MNTPKLNFVRDVARADDPPFMAGQVAGHRARRLIDAPDAAFTDPFVLIVAQRAACSRLVEGEHRPSDVDVVQCAAFSTSLLDGFARMALATM